MSVDADVRSQFPILERKIDGPAGSKPLVFMDHGASTHAPRPVLDAVMDLHTLHYANIHRGNHQLSLESSDMFDSAAETFSDFIGARKGLDNGDDCFVMLQNTTEALSLAAHVMADTPGVTLTTLLEHHSNDLPHRARGKVVHAEIDEQGRLDMGDLEAKLADHDVKLLSLSGCSNVTGYFPPIYEAARLAHDHGAKILVDAAQLYAHNPIDVRPRDHPEHIDFLAAAGHKSYAPFGSSFLYGPRDLFDAAPPYMPGGGTVDWVTGDNAWFTKSPDRHMGGTPNITGVVAFAAATKWLSGIGMENVRQHEVELIEHGLGGFDDLESRHDLRLLGPRTAQEKAGVFSFLIDDVRHETASTILSEQYGIATRNGCFCAHPLLHRLLGLKDTRKWTDALTRGEDILLPGATRATVGIYNTHQEVDLLLEAVDAIASGRFEGEYAPPEPSRELVEAS